MALPRPAAGGDAALQVARLLQERWSLAVVVALQDGPLGFNELQRTVGGAGATTLRQRLVALEDAGLLVRTVLSQMPPRTRYDLTGAGRALRPALDAMSCCTPDERAGSGPVMRLLGEKWVLPVLLALAEQPMGFNELHRTIGTASSATLTQRLGALEQAGLVARTASPPRTCYAITDAAGSFREVLRAIRAWTREHAGPGPAPGPG